MSSLVRATMLELGQYALGGTSGALVGFTLGLVGGGGSLLAVPLIVYVVGVSNPHIAIGTSALAVSANAALGLANHAFARTVNWTCGTMFAASGIIGALAGSTLGKQVDGQRLLFLFALVMIAVGILMLRRRKIGGLPETACDRQRAPKVLTIGLASGACSGFFGVGGGFLIVPGLIAATGMPMIRAVGTSLVVVTLFGLTTGLNYAASGLVDWPLAAAFIAGGFFGGLGGAALARRLSGAGRLHDLFAALIFATAAYMIWRTIMVM